MNTAYSKWYLAVMLIASQEHAYVFSRVIGYGNRWEEVPGRAGVELFCLERVRLWYWVSNDQLKAAMKKHIRIVVGKGVARGIMGLPGTWVFLKSLVKEAGVHIPGGLIAAISQLTGERLRKLFRSNSAQRG